MYCITDQQMDFILDDLRSKGILLEDLQQNLLDHICVLIEENLSTDGNFEQYYCTVIRSFYKKELSEIEEETRFLLTRPKYLLLLNRNQFFTPLFIIFLGPYITCAILDLTGIWPGDAWVFFTGWLALYSFPTLMVLLLTPDKYDPLIPRNARIMLGGAPIIRILPAS
ncbi:hypothetical protein Q4E93_00750 [Flavitalea sp. BT771]|uniref:hypothetical protein n=1 Tax=Flavitalea sp. BT771 TaxID=3063329 RepID=UPI0026E210CD|nr:hypothetical protein [Flavitalea sp. BT771]MDO6429093.1 hypothetical protein [Flavitalea sp. BT771]MDV6218779.1 hypothetical protein [Flavitalea sp. BT771]